jgi:hypothetical protein
MAFLLFQKKKKGYGHDVQKEKSKLTFFPFKVGSYEDFFPVALVLGGETPMDHNF